MQKTPKPTAIANLLKAALEAYGIYAESEWSDGHKHVDLRIPSARIDIEVDGSQHLTSSYQILADLQRDYYSDRDGFATIHVHNDEVVTNLSKISQAIAEAVRVREKLFGTIVVSD